jgi:hypothetical protein
VSQIQLEQIVEQIDQAFGQELPFSGRTLNLEDLDVLGRVFGDEGYQGYLQDQVNRQIIRDYLTNAVLLGYLEEGDLPGFSRQVATEEGRSSMSLHMLMSSVSEARQLTPENKPERLKNLGSDGSSHPHIRLVRS